MKAVSGVALLLEIEGKKYHWDKQLITGQQLKQLADIGLEEGLYLSVHGPWDDEHIANDAVVDLARQGLEEFFVRRPLHFTVDGKQFSWTRQFIKGAQIRRVASVSEEFEIFLDHDRKFQDVLIDDNDQVNLALPGTERFKSVYVQQEVVLVVNGKPRTWSKSKISFDEVIRLAGFDPQSGNPNIVFTVTYARGPRQNPEGSMVRGDKVRVQNKMIFNATATDKS